MPRTALWVATLLLASLGRPTTTTAATATAITAGAAHTCALTSAGAVKCWGSDEFGQLGDGGTNTDQPLPVGVTGLTAGVTAITAGFAHTCALVSDGAVLCWGSDVAGELGDGGTYTNQPLPVGVSGLSSGVEAIAAGGSHTCALTKTGGVLCWGSDSAGQLGDGGANTNQPTPVAVSDLVSGVVAITAGGEHTCGVTDAGPVLCWGSDSAGQIGDGGANTNQPTPVAVSGLPPGVIAIDAGKSHTCALTGEGALLCWGQDSNGQIGDGGANADQPTPVAVSGLSSEFAAVSAGGQHTCAISKAGAAQCWGRDAAGQLGDGGTNTNKSMPVAVIHLTSGVRAIAAGGSHTCAVTSTGAVWCWGSDSSGQLGDGGTHSDQPIPVVVGGFGSPLAMGSNHYCARTNAGAILCWGRDDVGQLGDGGAASPFYSPPVAVSGLSVGVPEIAAGTQHTCGVTDAGAVLCWGRDYEGQLGDGGANTNQSAPVAVSGLSAVVTAIAAGGDHTCALTHAGALLCWGSDSSGQLGDGSPNTNQSTPVAVSGLSARVTAIAAGGEHTCALTDAGAVLCWGSDEFGQLGDGGTNADQPTPVAVSGLSAGVTAIAASGSHTCALTNAGAVKCWGSDSQGQLGNGGTNADQPTPVAVSGLSSGVTAIAAGHYHTCALTDAGAVRCWGYNGAGQLGFPVMLLEPSSTPSTAVEGLPSGVTAIAAGSEMTCAVINGCGVVCWGSGAGDFWRPVGISEFSCAAGDLDGDGTSDASDNCVLIANSTQTDADGDTIGDACDNCPATCNPDQDNSDGDTGGGDVCDVCPAIDEAAEPAGCATATHDAALACCRDGAADGVSVDTAGPSCGAAGDVTFQTPPDPDTGTTVTVRIPAGAVSGPTSISATPMTQGGSEYVLDTSAGTFVTGAIMEPDGMSFISPLLICMAWQDADNDGFVDNAGSSSSIAESHIRPTRHGYVTIRGVATATTEALGWPCGLQAACGALGVDGVPATVPGTLFDRTLAACCSATHNVYCFEVNHFSAYALADLSCAGAATGRVIATRMNQPTGTQGLKVKGQFDLGAEVPGGLDPVTSGFELAILSADGTPLYQVTLPAGEYSRETNEGWKMSARGGSAQWKSKTGIAGVTKVKLEWDGATGQGHFDLKGKDLSLAVTEADLPLQAEVRLDPEALAGHCALAAFTAPSDLCSFNGSGSTLLCQ